MVTLSVEGNPVECPVYRILDSRVVLGVGDADRDSVGYVGQDDQANHDNTRDESSETANCLGGHFRFYLSEMASVPNANRSPILGLSVGSMP